MNLLSLYYLVPLTISGIVPLFIIYFVYKKEKRVYTNSFITLMLILSFWSIIDVIGLLIQDPFWNLFIGRLSYISVNALPVALLVFTYKYIGRAEVMTKKKIILLSIIPFISFTLLMTNEYHSLFYKGIEITTLSDGYLTSYEGAYSTFWWIATSYLYVLFITSYTLLMIQLVRMSHVYVKLAVILSIGILVPFIANILTITDLLMIDFDLTPFFFIITEVTFFWAIINHKFLDIRPLAREQVFNSLDDAVFVLDTNKRIIEVNDKAVNLVKQEVIKHPTTDLIGLKARELFYDSPEIMKCGKKKQSISFEHKNNYYRARTVPIMSAGEKAGCILTISDVTQIKRAEELKAEAEKEHEINKLRQAFMMRITHELRQPLVPIMGYAETLLEKIKSKSNKKQLQRILDNSKRLKYLIDNAVTLVSLESGREINLQATNLKKVVNEAVTNYQNSFGFNGLELIKDFEDVPESLIDEIKFKRAIFNLLDNAVKNTDKGTITIKLEQKENNLFLSIRDTGKGMSPKLLKQLRKNIYITNLEPEQIRTGFGIGLLLTNMIVEAHNGSLEIKSEEGKGTEVRIELPIK